MDVPAYRNADADGCAATCSAADGVSSCGHAAATHSSARTTPA